MKYIDRVLENLVKKTPNEKEYHQAVTETLISIEPILDSFPRYEGCAILERLLEPERVITFRVAWRDENNRIKVNKGYRVQFNSAVGPFKGGLRFHPTVNLSIMKFLAFEQTLKNAITGLPIGGAKGGSDFDPKGKSEIAIMTFCQNFMIELYRHIGASTDIPAGDIGVGSREIGYLFGQYKRIRNMHEGVLTGKSPEFDGLVGRKEATGFGLIYFTERMLNANGESLKNKKICVSGAGNVAIYATQKAQEYGAKVITMSDSSGWIYDPDGINLEAVQTIKETNRGRISEYLKFEPKAKYTEGKFNWDIPCDVAMPCATQNELLLSDAKNLVKNGVKFVSEGANMPTNLDATNYFVENNIIFGPAKAANAGGVTSSVIEMSQNSSKMPLNPELANKKLESIMQSIFRDISREAEELDQKGNYILGANVLGFKRVAASMMALGVI